jgi:hypothetical protein
MYEVGQILFAISRQGSKVFPIQVVEKTIKKNLKGETCTHSVILPNRDSTVATLEELEVDVYMSAIEAQESMMRNAHSAIQKMILRAKDVASNYFNVKEEEIQEDSGDRFEPEGDTQYIVLENGTKARVKIPSMG